MRNAIILLSMAILLPSLSNAQDFWQQTNGPSIGYIGSLAINSSGHIFAGTGAGVFRSTDDGDHWIPINTGLTRLEITSLLSYSMRIKWSMSY